MIFANKPIGTIGYLGGLAATLESFTWAWGQLIQYNAEYLVSPGQFVHYTKATMSFHSFARNNLVDTMLGEWLLQLDTDHAPEPDLAVRMLSLMNQTGVDVLTALYLHKTPPHSPVLYQMGTEGGFKPIGDWDQQVSAFQVGSAGAGALLVKKSVFERIRKELKQGPFDIEYPYGEDHSFFRRLEKLKIPVFAAPRIESPHLMVKPVTFEDYRSKQRELQFSDRTEVQGFS